MKYSIILLFTKWLVMGISSYKKQSRKKKGNEKKEGKVP
jgi:hypothetical protein